MLGKLIKHEFKAVNRLMIPLHLALIVISVIGRFYIQFVGFSEIGSKYLSDNLWFGILSGSLAGLYILALIAVCIVTQLYLLVLRPRKNLFTDEGYLTHTLPVTASAHIWSKLIVAFVWSIIDVILIALSVLAMFVNKEFLEAISQIGRELIASFPDAFGVTPVVGLPLFIVAALLDTISGILIVYMCLAIGHSFNTHKILASVGIYAGYNVVVSLISSIFVSITGTNTLSRTTAIISYTITNSAGGYFLGIMIFSIILGLVVSAAAFVVTGYFMKKRLNLE